MIYLLTVQYNFSLWKKLFPSVDADAGVNQREEGASKVSIESKVDESQTTDNSSDVEKKKPKKEKIGFRDRKV